MNKKRKRGVLSFLILAFCLAFVLFAPLLAGFHAAEVYALGEVQKPLIVDEADLLTVEQEQQLQNKLTEIQTRLGFDVVIVTVPNTGMLSATEYADKYYEDGDYGAGANRDGTLLLVDTGNMEWATSTAGYGITALTDYGLDQIETEVVNLMADDKWYESFDTYATRVDEYITSAKNGHIIDVPVQPEPEKPPFPWAASGGISAALGALIGKIRTGSAKSQLKTVYSQTKASNYAVRESLELDRSTSRDLYLYSNVTRVPIAQGPRNDGNTHHGGSVTHVSHGGMTHGGHSGKIGKR